MYNFNTSGFINCYTRITKLGILGLIIMILIYKKCFSRTHFVIFLTLLLWNNLNVCLHLGYNTKESCFYVLGFYLWLTI